MFLIFTILKPKSLKMPCPSRGTIAGLDITLGRVDINPRGGFSRPDGHVMLKNSSTQDVTVLLSEYCIKYRKGLASAG